MGLFGRQPSSFADSLQKTVQNFYGSRDLNETIDFPSGVPPNEVDRASLGKFLGLVILPVLEIPNCSLVLTVHERASTWSRSMGDRTEAMSPPPWRVAHAVVDELTKAANLSGTSSKGSLHLALNGRDLSLDIEKTDSPSGLIVTITHRN